MKSTSLRWAPLNISIALAICSSLCVGCVVDQQCGWNAVCSTGQCSCRPGYAWAYNDRDCVNSFCEDENCLDCTDADQCRRCVDFIEEDSGSCLTSCEREFYIMLYGAQVGKVCTVENHIMVYVYIIIGVCVGLVITAGLVLFLYCRLSKREKDPKFRANVLSKGIHSLHDVSTIPNGTLQKPKAMPVYDNHAFESDIYRHVGEDSKFFLQVSELRPHKPTFMTMLSEAKIRCNDLKPDDKRLAVYRNVIHQLCRVVTLLGEDQSELTMPSDGVALVTWAHKILSNYLLVSDDEDSISKASIKEEEEVGDPAEVNSQDMEGFDRCSGDGEDMGVPDDDVPSIAETWDTEVGSMDLIADSKSSNSSERFADNKNPDFNSNYATGGLQNSETSSLDSHYSVDNDEHLKQEADEKSVSIDMSDEDDNNFGSLTRQSVVQLNTINDKETDMAHMMAVSSSAHLVNISDEEADMVVSSSAHLVTSSSEDMQDSSSVDLDETLKANIEDDAASHGQDLQDSIDDMSVWNSRDQLNI